MRIWLLLAFTGAAFAQKTCGLPENFHSLPDYAQEELEAVWKNYVPGTDCSKQQTLTEDVLAVLATLNEELAPTLSPVPVQFDDQHNVSPDNHVISGERHLPLTPIETSSGDSDYDVATTESTRQTRAFSFGSQNNDDDYSEDDVDMMQFDDISSATFLQGASRKVKAEFDRVWNDDDIPSNSLKMHKIQMLAVSLLSGEQLLGYNTWVTKRRRVLKAREQHLRPLSREAKRALRMMAQNHGERMAIAPKVKNELRQFMELRRRRKN